LCLRGKHLSFVFNLCAICFFAVNYTLCLTLKNFVPLCLRNKHFSFAFNLCALCFFAFNYTLRLTLKTLCLCVFVASIFLLYLIFAPFASLQLNVFRLRILRSQIANNDSIQRNRKN